METGSCTGALTISKAVERRASQLEVGGVLKVMVCMVKKS